MTETSGMDISSSMVLKSDDADVRFRGDLSKNPRFWGHRSTQTDTNRHSKSTCV